MVKWSDWVFMLFLIASPALLGQTTGKVINKIWDHLGGRDTYRQARYLEFEWVVKRGGKKLVARHHIWDRYTGKYVLSMRDTRKGDSLRIYFNINTHEGVAFKNGKMVEEKEGQELIEMAYASYINDSYWLLCPAKLEDPGVQVSLAHQPGLSVLHLKFEKVGLTPDDQYWLYVTDAGKVLKWRYRLQSGREGEFRWVEERDCGMGLKFAARKVNTEKNLEIVFPKIEFSSNLGDDVFSPGYNK